MLIPLLFLPLLHVEPDVPRPTVLDGDCPAHDASHHAQPVQLGDASDPDANNPIFNHGKWCGPQHGGFQDCCNGTWCPSCGPGPVLGNYSYTFDQSCLTKECIPIDAIDMACAWHDACTFMAGQSCGRYYDGQHCFCNCVLYKAACFFDRTSKVCLVFSPWDPTMQCWSCLNETNVTCHGEGEVAGFCQDVTNIVQMVDQLAISGDPRFWDARKYHEACFVRLFDMSINYA